MKKIMNEKLTISNIFPLKARFYEYQHFTYPWHFHSEYEIIYIQESTGTRFIGNSIDKYGAGDILLLGSNLPHYLKSDEQYHQMENQLLVKGIIIQFEQEFMHHSISNYPQFVRIKRLLEDAKDGIIFPTEKSKKLLQKLRKIPFEKGMQQFVTFLQLLEEMAEIKDRSIISHSEMEYNMNQVSDRIDKIVAFIQKNYTRSINLDEIASLASMNPTAFCRFFKNETGKSFKNYIFDMRIAYACKLLLINKLTISQVSLECGFETISHFNKVFRKVTDYSPSEYRKIML